MSNTIYFFLGVVAGIGLTISWGIYLALKERFERLQKQTEELEQLKKAARDTEKAVAEELQKTLLELTQRRDALQAQLSGRAETPADPNNNPSVKERLRKATDLTTQQSRIDPRKGPEFQLQHNELELEKLTVLKTILADGFDPVVTVRYNTGDQTMLLSSYVASLTKALV